MIPHRQALRKFHTQSSHTHTHTHVSQESDGTERTTVRRGVGQLQGVQFPLFNLLLISNEAVATTTPVPCSWLSARLQRRRQSSSHRRPRWQPQIVWRPEIAQNGESVMNNRAQIGVVVILQRQQSDVGVLRNRKTAPARRSRRASNRRSKSTKRCS